MPAPSGAGFLVLLMKKRLTANVGRKRSRTMPLWNFAKIFPRNRDKTKRLTATCEAKRVKGDALVELCKNISPKSLQNKTPHSKCGA